LPFKLHFDSLQANLSIPTFSISQIEPNYIGIQFHPLARLESFGNIRCTYSFFATLMTRVFLHSSAPMRYEMYWMTVGLCLIDIIRSLSQEIVSVSPALIFESLAIFFGCP
jgi:hypothetical protein